MSVSVQKAYPFLGHSKLLGSHFLEGFHTFQLIYLQRELAARRHRDRDGDGVDGGVAQAATPRVGGPRGGRLGVGLGARACAGARPGRRARGRTRAAAWLGWGRTRTGTCPRPGAPGAIPIHGMLSKGEATLATPAASSATERSTPQAHSTRIKHGAQSQTTVQEQ